MPKKKNKPVEEAWNKEVAERCCEDYLDAKITDISEVVLYNTELIRKAAKAIRKIVQHMDDLDACVSGAEFKAEVNKRTLLMYRDGVSVRKAMDKAEEELIAERKKESLKRTSQKA